MSDLLKLLSFGPTGWGDEILAGTWLTIRLALATLPVGLAIGFLVALAKRSPSRVLYVFGEAFSTIFRGLPELLTIFIVYFGFSLALQWIWQLFSDTPIEISGFVAGMVALGVVFAAYSSEVFAAAFGAIPKGQWEGAAAIGLRKSHTLRLVIFPQLIRLALPGLANLWLILLKDTALVSVISVNDLLRMTYQAVSYTKQPFFLYLVACLIYLVMSIISSFGINAIERWAERGDRARETPRTIPRAPKTVPS
jgi:polar amino acid transport system permease protein